MNSNYILNTKNQFIKLNKIEFCNIKCNKEDLF